MSVDLRRNSAIRNCFASVRALASLAEPPNDPHKLTKPPAAFAERSAPPPSLNPTHCAGMYVGSPLCASINDRYAAARPSPSVARTLMRAL